MEVTPHEAMRNFRKADQVFRRSIERLVEGTGVYRSQHQLLMNLGRNPDCSQKDLAVWLDITPAAVTTTLKKLEKGGYITRLTDPKDNRANCISITEKGQQVIEQSHVLFREVEDRALTGFSEEERQKLNEYVIRIRKNLEVKE